VASWLRIRAGCPACGLRYERDEESVPSPHAGGLR
jgi:hypothetical protein